MDAGNWLKATRTTGRAASNTPGLNVFTAPVEAIMVGRRQKHSVTPLSLTPITPA